MVWLTLVLVLTGASDAATIRLDGGFVLEPVEYETQLVELCFPSGLRVAVQHEARAPVVSITAVVDAGSTSNPAGKDGLAHLVEHLWFRSASPEYQRGGVHNGATGAETTRYYQGVGKELLHDALVLEARRLSEPLRGLTEVDLEVEKRVVGAELAWRGEDTHRVAVGRMYRKLYPPDHPYHRVSGGTRESVAAITMEDVRAFVGGHYLPEYTTLLIVGDVTPDEVKATMDQAFPADLLYAEGPECVPRVDPLIPQPPEPPEPAFERIEAPVSHPTLWLGWTLPGAWRDDTENELATVFLELAVLSRIRRVRHHRDDRFHVDCALRPEVEASTALCAIQLPWDVDGEKVARKALAGVADLWEDERDTWRDEILLPMVAHGYRSGLVRSIEEQLQPGSWISENTALNYHYTGDPRWLRQRIVGLDRVDERRVGDVARRWLTRERGATLLVEPVERPVEVPSPGTVSRAQADPPPESVDVAAATGALDLSGSLQATLDNGLDVVILPFGDAPLVRAALVLGGGSATVGQGVELVVDRQNIYAAKGFPAGLHFGALAIGGDMGWQNQPTWSADHVSASSGNLDEALTLLRIFANSPVFQPVKRSTLVDAEVAALRRLYDSPWGWAARVRGDALWPVGSQVGARTSDAWVRRGFDVSDADVRAELKRRYQAGNASLYVVGRIDDPAAALALVRKHFSRWKGTGDVPVPELGRPEGHRARQVQFLEHASAQTEIHLECTIDVRDGGEAGDVLVDYLDLVLYQGLRTAQGAAYTPVADLVRYPGGAGVLSVSTSVSHPSAASALATMLSLLDGLVSEGPEAGRLEASKLRVARRTSLEHLTTYQTVWGLIDADWNGGGRDLLPERGARLAGVTADDLRSLAAQCVGQEVVTLVAPAAVAQQLDEAGLDYSRRDWKAEVHALVEKYDRAWLVRRGEE